MTNEERDIAIVGISVYCPAGESVEEFWDGLARGGDFISDVPPDVIESYHFDGEPNGIDQFYCRRGGFSRAFKVDPLRYGILPITADGVDPDQLVSMAGTEQALRDAGIFERGVSLNRCSIIIGKGNFSGIIPLRSLEIIRMARQFTELLKIALPDLTEKDLEVIRKAYQAKQGRYQADMAIGTMPSLVASLVANRFDMHGPAYTVDAACASGILAIHHSLALLRTGQCDLAVAGGMHAGHSAMFWGAFDMMGAMSHRGQIAPFSEDADGLLVGQGGGFVVLKTLRRAQEDGDRIYAIIKDTAIASDGGGSHVMVTSVAGQVRVLKQAWERAGMDPERVGYIEAHGTATPVGDRTEVASLKEFFGDNTHAPALLGSLKSNIGHTMPAAGMLGIIKTALSLYNRKIPPTLHCEKPLAALYETRFLPPQELIDWEEDRYPLVAGVNAFGFGGINSHAIMTPYDPPVGAPPQPKPRPYRGEALMISAVSNEALIKKLETGDYTNTGGDYRIVIFSPDDDRIEKAITIVKKDKPWRGRLDIWFSNHPLLTEDSKIVFLCPGFGPESAAETESISELLDLPYIDDLLAEQDSNERTQISLRYYFTAWLCKEGLRKLGIEPDIFTGHSIGDWNATVFAGMTGGDWNKINGSLIEWDLPVQYPLVAVGGINSATAEQWCAEIPDLYLANDNCPSQVLLCGKQEAVDTLVKRLIEEKLFYTMLPYGTGYHTPLMPSSEGNAALLENVELYEGTTPVWSSTTMEPIPTDREEYAALVESQLRRPVYFRGLIEKLYAEQNARVFIQVGLGMLVGFVEDTLKGQEFSAVAGTTTGRNGAEQLRRVLAALFIEGREVDAEFLGVKSIYCVEHSLRIVARGAPPIITDLPEIAEAVKKRYGAAGLRFAWDTAPETGGDPILTVANINMREAMEVQTEMLQLFGRVPKSTPRDAGAQGDAQKVSAVSQGTAAAPPKAPAGLPPNFEEDLLLTFEDHPYLVDHSIVRQPDGWDCADDLNLIVPFTMTIELLAEIALKHAPGRKLLSISKVAAYRWISVEQPFEGLVKGSWKKSSTLELNLDGYAKAEFTFGDAWLEPPQEYLGAIDVGPKIMETAPTAVMYDRYSFHGPQYHCSTEFLKAGARGMINLAEKREGKGSLLDVMGQQLGLFLHLTQTENTISFPVRLKSLDFYADIFDQGGSFEHTMVITKLTNNSVTADMVLKRDGKIWSVARDFVCQRFHNYMPVWYVILKPQYNLLADEIAPGVYHYTNINEDNVLGMLLKRYLNAVDRDVFEGEATLPQLRDCLGPKVVLKDAVRALVLKRSNADEMIYPVEISYEHDEKGRPFVYGKGETAALLEGICVSLSHKDKESVAIAAETPVGIDIEKVEEKADSFMEVAFTEKERELLAKLEQPEGLIRFWVAKEACAKKAGTGLEGNPKHFEVAAIDGDVLTVGDDRVQTMKRGDEYIVGWTL
jgi:3-oxoacyl-(acyl-carrier-protein) synthase/malonyl CoA-acyl carrier protein transacylase/phosphopantetheinyl transferase (holo-ACP synthase)